VSQSRDLSPIPMESFVSQCIAKGAVSLSTVNSSCLLPTNTLPVMSTLSPSELQASINVEGEEDAWLCDVCSHLNSDCKAVCDLCWRGRDDALTWSMHDEILSTMDTPLELADIKEAQGKRGCSQSFQPMASSPARRSTGSEENGSVQLSPGNTVYSSNGSNMAETPAGASPNTYITAVHNGVTSRISIKPSKYRPDLSDDENDCYLYTGASPPYKCHHEGCIFETDSIQTINSHIKSCLGPHDTVMDEDGVVQYHCRFEACDKFYSDQKLLRKHILTHKEKLFVCHYPGCERKFYERAKLKRHFLVHTGEKPYFCSYEGCGKRFGYNANLKTHMKTHVALKPYACTVDNCKHRFARAQLRDQHTLVHQKQVQMRVLKLRTKKLHKITN
jgi:hypothetical protein